MHDEHGRSEVTRRRVLGLGAGVVLAAGSGALGSLLTACSGGEESAAPAPPEEIPSQASPPEAKPPAAAPSDAGASSPSGGAPQAAADDAKLITAYPENEALVESLKYVHESAKPDQQCSNCFFFTAVGGERGNCQLFSRGLVEAAGWCTSWQAKPA